MKYILEIKPEYEANGIMILGARDSHLYVTTLEVKDLEELNSDYINEHYGDLMDEEIRQAVSEVREMKKMCGNINMKLTNIVTQRGQDWKKKLEAEYQRGLEDAWEAARKIGHASQMKLKEMEFDFTDKDWCYNPSWYVVMNYTSSEAIEKLKAYEEKQKAEDEIKVGDEVEVLNSGSKYLIAWFAGTSICGFAHDGVTCHLQPSDVRKTGRHFDIASILKEMQS